MTARSILAMGRRASARLRMDTCTVVRPGDPVVDPDTGETTRPTTPVYSGPCRLKSRGDWSTERDVGENLATILSTELQLPIGAGARINDLVTIDTSATNPQLATRTFTLRGEFVESQDTCERWQMIDPE